MSQTIKLEYGRFQPLLSSRMLQYPRLSRLVNALFGYTNIGNFARSLVFRRQIATLPLRQFHKILDLGCGYGEYAFMMARALPGARIVALDIDPDALRNVRRAQEQVQLQNIEIQGVELESLAEEAFDLIYSVDVFEHIPEQAMPFREAYQKLRPGGYLMVKMPNIVQQTVLPAAWFDAHQQWVDHEHPGQVYDLEGLSRRFEQEKFEVVAAYRTDGWLSRLAWEIAYLMKKGGPVLQLISVPWCKLLVRLDNLSGSRRSSRGNAITVIGRKISLFS